MMLMRDWAEMLNEGREKQGGERTNGEEAIGMCVCVCAQGKK